MANLVRFDCFEVDMDQRRLYRRGLKVHLRDKSFQILVELVEHPGEVVTRENLRQLLWGNDVFVDFENNLNTTVAHLREALGDSSEHPRFIETVLKFGYRFIGEVSAPTNETAQSPQKRLRIVVLPFINLTGDSRQEYFTDAMTGKITTALSMAAPDQLAVIARTTAMRYKNSRKDVTSIRRELAVDYVVEGGVFNKDDWLSVNVNLIDARNQTQLFAHKYSAGMNSIFELQREIAVSIALHVSTIAGAQVKRTGLRSDLRKKPANNLPA